MFTTLVRDLYQEPAVHLMQLRNHIKQGKAKDIIKGITVTKEAWDILDKYYWGRGPWRQTGLTAPSPSLRHSVVM